MADKLRPLVQRLDQERARPHRLEPERLVLSDRPPREARRVCLACRRPYDPEMARAHRERWLAEHPMPDCPPEWLEWERERYLRRNLPTITHCPFCDGQLVEVS
jgi:hypothetical protein